jgi:bacterioferritin-associated ferredoxin
MESGLGGVSDETVKNAISNNIEKSKKKLKSIRSFIENIPDFVPCEVCATHAQKFIDEHQPPLDNLQSPDDLLNTLMGAVCLMRITAAANIVPKRLSRC